MISSSATRVAAARAGRVNGASSFVRRAAGLRSSRLSRNGPPALIALRGRFPLMLYSTERIIEQRSGKNNGKVKSLYNASRETENCGVGLVASLKSIPSRKVVDDADEMLVRMSHRGGCGCDPASGDGAGKSE